MAQTVKVIIEDDLDGGAADETVSFGLDGVEYDIDLNAGNAERLRDDILGEFVAAARRTGGRVKRGLGHAARAAREDPSLTRSATRAGAQRNGTVDRTQTQAVRAWARKQGFQVSDRGRIPGDVQDAFEAAHARRQ